VIYLEINICSITEQLRLVGTSGGHLVQPFYSSRVTKNRLPRTMSRWLLNISEGRLHNVSGQPVPVLSHPHIKKVFPDVQREPSVFLFVPIASRILYYQKQG